LHAAEQDRPDVVTARKAWRRRRWKAKLRRLIFIDETSTKTNMVRLRGRSRRGKRLVDKTPHGHWKTSTFIAALRHNRLAAPFTIDGAVNGEVFLAYVRRVLVPILKKATSSSWTTLVRTKSRAYMRRFGPPARHCCSFRLIVLI
jgi:DDE superfamily endonuclease